jgi:EmrB/QacA subfamily drug resistance transporter
MQHTTISARLVLTSICTAIFLGALDLTVATAILPRILVDLEVSIDSDFGRAAWVITGYLLAYTLGVFLAGQLSDRYGRRKCYIIGLLTFILGSLAAAIAPTLEWLIAARVLSALGAGAIVPIAMALTGDLFPVASRAQALGVIAAVDTAGWMVGHLYGGALMRLFDDWRLIFWINLPLGLAALAITLHGLRGIITAPRTGHFDWLGALLASAALAAFNIGLGAGAELGIADFYGERSGPPAYALPLLLLALCLFIAFIWHERRSAAPLLDSALLTKKPAMAACTYNLLIGFALAIALAAVPLFINARLSLQAIGDADVLRRAAWDTGILLSALTLTMAATAWPGGKLAARAGARLPAIISMLLALLGFAVSAQWHPAVTYPTMAFGLACVGIGLGLGLAPGADLLIGQFGATQRGSGAALVITLRLIGMTLGISAFTIWGVQRQDALRRFGAADPLALSDPATFLLGIVSQVVREGILFAALGCALGILCAWWFDRQR